MAALGETARTRLPPLIRRLAEVSRGPPGAGLGLTARAVPLTEAAPDADARALVDALVSARLLTLSGAALPSALRGEVGGGGQADTSPSAETHTPAPHPLSLPAQISAPAHASVRRVGRGSDEGPISVRLAHQRVLSDWTRAAAIVAESADFYRVRDEVEDQRRRWETGNRRGELLLSRGLPLAEARTMAGCYGSELAPETMAYIAASRRRANRAQAIGWAAATVFALLAVGAGVAAKVAFDQKQIAQRNFNAAKTTVDGLIFNIAQGLQNVAGMRVETIRKVLETTRQTVDQLLATAPNDPQLLRSRAIMLNNFAKTYEAAGDLKDALAAAAESLDIDKKLAAQGPGDTQAQSDLANGWEKMGDVTLKAGDGAGALAAYQQGLDIVRKLATQDPSDAEAQDNLSASLDNIGEAKLRGGDQAGALAAYQQGLAIRKELAKHDPRNARTQRDVSISFNKIGNLKFDARDPAGALAAYQESLRIDRELARQDPDNAQARLDVSISLEGIGAAKSDAGDGTGALAAFQESLDIQQELSTLDPGNVDVQRDMAIDLEEIGGVRMQTGDPAGALAAYQKELDVNRKLAAQDPGNALAKSDLALCLGKIGDLKRDIGDKAGALAAYREGVGIFKTLAAQDPGNANVQRNLSVSLEGIGGTKLLAGDRAGALAAYQDSLGIRKKLAAQDPSNAQAQQDVIVSLGSTAYSALFNKDYSEALGDSDQAIALASDQLWPQTNRAHALMLLGRTEEARTLYLKYRGKIAQNKTTWDKSVMDDFAALRKAGITNPLMDEITADFAEPSTKAP